jgi:hypothetical protein
MAFLEHQKCINYLAQKMPNEVFWYRSNVIQNQLSVLPQCNTLTIHYLHAPGQLG